MDEYQINQIDKNLKVVYRFTEEHKKAREILCPDKNDKFFKYSIDLYGDCEWDKYMVNTHTSPNIKYQPFEKFNKIAEEKCIPNISDITMYNVGTKHQYKKLEYISYPNRTAFYKTMDGFYSLEEENKFINKNRNTPFWFSSPYLAYMAIGSRHGGINAYITIDTVNILEINCDNIKNLIDIVKINERDKINIRNQWMDKQYILDLLRLSSCSEKNFMNQLQIFNKFNNYENELWLTKEPLIAKGTLCEMKIDNTNYFGITKQKGKHNYNFAYLLAYLNKKYLDNKFDGYLIKMQYTPYFMTGSTLEEFVFFDAYSKCKRNIEDQYDWHQYKSYLDFQIPENFRLDKLFSQYNENFELYKFYNKSYLSSKNKILLQHLNNNISIVYLDVNNFKSINVNDDKDKLKNKLTEFTKYVNADIFLLLNAPDFDIDGYHNIKVQRAVYYYKNKKIKDKLKILFVELFNKPFPYKRPIYDDFLAIAQQNYNNNIKQIDISINHKPNIIFMKANLTYNSPEFGYVQKYGYETKKIETCIFPNNKDYIFTNFKNTTIEILDYPYSYFYPILVKLEL